MASKRIVNELKDVQKDPQTSCSLGAQTAWEILHEEQVFTHITTSCEDLDNILGGGICCREVTEIGGVPGIGKTQLGIQLAVNVQIPVDYGGLGGKAIYIDTEGSFMVERVFQIVEACIQDTLDNCGLQHKEFQACGENMQPKTFLANIFYFRVCSYTEQIAVINYLDKFIAEQNNVKLIIIDSVTFHFRQDFEDFALRTRLLGGMALKLMKLARKFSLAVVLFNQVTTKFIEGSYQLALALGIIIESPIISSGSFFNYGVSYTHRWLTQLIKVIAGRMRAQTELFCIGMEMSDVHT